MIGVYGLQKNFTRFMALFLAICLIAGAMFAIFAVLPVLLPFMLAAGVAAYLIWRFRRGKRKKKIY